MQKASFLEKCSGPLAVITIFSCAVVLCIAYPILTAADVQLGDIWLTVSGIIIIAIVCFLLFLPLMQISSQFIRHQLLSLMLLLVGAYLVGDSYHYFYLGEHLYYEASRLAVLAIRVGEFEVPRNVWLKVGAGIIAWQFLLPVIINALGKLLLAASSLRPIALVSVAIFPVCTFLLLRPHTLKASPLNSVFIWQDLLQHALLEESEAFNQISAGITFGDQDIQKEFTTLQERQKKLAAQEIHSALKPDVVIVTVEGLRYDMLSPQYMPHLTQLSKDFIQLTQHYTTGANTSSGEFGIATGLSTYFFPFYRMHETSPVPYQIFRKLGYDLSYYYSKDMHYDNIFGLLYEKNFAKVINPPEIEYAAWDGELIDEYISRLRKRSSADAPHLDQLRLFSTHFNYYYPPSFEHFLPTLSPDFTISSRKSAQFQQAC